jgi:hypothetical protein
LNQQFRHRPLQAGNPLANALVVIVGVIVISLSLTLGFFLFLGITAFLLVAAAIFGVRSWWYRRGISRSGRRRQAQPSASRTTRQVIEGEFQDVSRRDADRRPR